MKHRRARVAVLIVLSAALARPVAAQTVEVQDAGPYLVLVDVRPRGWDRLRVEVNDYFTYLVRWPANREPTRSVCIDLAAFVIKPAITKGRDFEGIDHFDPATMHVRKVTSGNGLAWRVFHNATKPVGRAADTRCGGR